MAKRSSNFTRVLDKVLKAEYVYVKNTGIRVLVTDIDFHKGQRTITGHVKFIDTPNKKTLLMCEQCNIDVRENNKAPSVLGAPTPSANPSTFDTLVNAVMDLDNLSIFPYETRAAKILYKKEK